MKYSALTKNEIAYFVNECNFTDDERAYFIHKTRGDSDVKISFDLNVSSSTVTRIGQRVKRKYLKSGGQ